METTLLGGPAMNDPIHRIGAANHHEKLFLNSPRRGAGKLSTFTRPHVRLFCGISSGITGENRFVRRTSDGETTLSSFTWPDNQKPRVCILGGGFGGLYTALRLESLEWPDDRRPQILLVDQSDRFVFKPMLYELLSGEVDAWEIAPQFTELLKNTNVNFIKDRVKMLHPSDHLSQVGMKGLGRSCPAGTVHLESGVMIEYDWYISPILPGKCEIEVLICACSLPIGTRPFGEKPKSKKQNVQAVGSKRTISYRKRGVTNARLVLALGAESKLDSVPGSAELALPFSTLEHALKVDNKLKILERELFGKDSCPIRVAIVGCGYSGIELAATISERLQNKGIVQAINVQTTICANAPPGNREAALKVLQSRNIQLFLGYLVSCIKEVPSSEYSARKMENGEEMGNDAGICHNRFILELQPAERGLESQILEADLVLWTVGSKPLVSELDYSDRSYVIPLNARGQAETDETLQIKGHPRIFAIGDSAALRDSFGRLLPYTAQVAFQQADFAGWNLWAAINDRPLLPFRFQNLGEMMTLGRNDAAISPSFIEGLTLDGPVGHAARKIAYLLRLPTDEHRLKVGLSWLTKSTIDSVVSLQSTLANVLSGS